MGVKFTEWFLGMIFTLIGILSLSYVMQETIMEKKEHSKVKTFGLIQNV